MTPFFHKRTHDSAPHPEMRQSERYSPPARRCVFQAKQQRLGECPFPPSRYLPIREWATDGLRASIMLWEILYPTPEKSQRFITVLGGFFHKSPQNYKARFTTVCFWQAESSFPPQYASSLQSAGNLIAAFPPLTRRTRKFPAHAKAPP